MTTILIVEDDPAVRLLTKARLENSYKVEEACDGTQALEVLERTKVDLMIVDIQMPRMNGYQLVRELREGGDMTPVIMLTALDSLDHKREGFQAGIDDYITKPFSREELVWRVEAVLRRARIASENRIILGRFSMDRVSHAAQRDGVPIPLTSKEFDLCYLLLSYPGVVLTHQQIMDEVWGYESEAEYDTIKVHISRLRGKLSHCDEFEIVAVRGLGYKAIIKEGM